jgi:ribosome recycling factor
MGLCWCFGLELTIFANQTKSMTEEIQMVLDEFQKANEKSVAHLKSELEKIRAGKATPSMLDSVMVEYYGAMTPINQVANVTTTDARTIIVQPWERKMLDEIAKGILNANLGFTPQNNGEVLIINVPALTEERRRELVKKSKAEGEQAKVGIRNNRKEAMDMLKDLKNDGMPEDLIKVGEAKVEDLTRAFISKIDDIILLKEADIMKV